MPLLFLFAALLLLRSFWQPAMGIVAALFVTNVFLVPSSPPAHKRARGKYSGRGRSKLWFWGFALLAAALIRLAFFVQSGFSWPVSQPRNRRSPFGHTVSFFVAKKSKEVTH